MGRECFFLAFSFMERIGLLPFEGIYNLGYRLRKINDRYRLFYNRQNGHFELYSSCGFHLQKELDFGEDIDLRCLYKTYTTKSENVAKIMQLIDVSNAKLEENALFSGLDMAMQKVKEAVSYADKTSRDLSEEDLKKIYE